MPRLAVVPSRPSRRRLAAAFVVRVAPAGILALLVLLLVAASPSSAGAATTEFGSPLQNTPNVAGGCESKPMVSPQDFDTYVPVPSGAASCTWWQIGTFGIDPATDTRRGYVPGDGTITAVTIRSGPSPAPLRVVVARQLTAFGANAPLSGPVCCVYAGQSEELRPAPNTTTTFALNVPVEHHRDLQKGIQTDDIVGVSAQSGAGTLPLFAIPGKTRQSAFTQTGTLDAAGMWPALGTQPNDTGGGRSNEGFAGFEVTARFTYCDGAATRDRATARATCGGAATGGGTAGGGTAGGTAGGTGGGGAGATGAGGGSAGAGATGTATPLAVRLAAPRQRLVDARRSGSLALRCTLDAAGTCTVRASVTRAVARRLRIPVRATASSVQIASARVVRTKAGTSAVRARLTSAARRALRTARGTVRTTVVATAEATGRATTSARTALVLRR